METITLPRFIDSHLHLRNGNMLRKVIGASTSYCSHAVIMPNLTPHITNNGMVREYRSEIDACRTKDFIPLMTLSLQDTTTPEEVMTAWSTNPGIVAVKAYPIGSTTNTEEQGVRDFFTPNFDRLFGAMSDMGIPLLIHGEMSRPTLLVTEREQAFLSILVKLHNKHPKLKISIEHVTTREGVDLIAEIGAGHDTISATITPHHLVLTLNDVLGSGIRPHNMCLPVPKTHDDREALIEAATSGSSLFRFGSDSAPHPLEKKECSIGSCGVFSAPVAPEILATVFEERGALDKLPNFVRGFAEEYFGIQKDHSTGIKLEKTTWQVPGDYYGIVPLYAGEKLPWYLV